ncbi:MAG: hypothetical protein RL693_487 [Verrucomicrobiota bacterium]
MKINLLLLASMLVLGSFKCGMAADAADPDLPQPFDAAVAEPLLSSSPFTRSLNLSDSLVLTGIAYIEGKPIATVLNKATKESFIVSEVPNVQGWKLAETSATVALNKTQAKIMVGNEIVTIRYSEEQLTPEAMKKGGFKPGQGGGGEQHGDDRGARRDYPRPDPETIKRWQNLSDDAKNKLRERMMESREKLQNASPEERKAHMEKILEKAEKEDRKSK